MTIKRFGLVDISLWGDPIHDIREVPNGDYVLFDDHLKDLQRVQRELQSQIDCLEEEVWFQKERAHNYQMRDNDVD